MQPLHELSVIFQEIARKAVRTLLTADLSTADGQTAAVRTLHDEALGQFCDYFRGQAVYVPRMETMLRDRLDAAIYKDFRGNNVGELVEKYGLHRNTIRKAVRRHAKRASATEFS